ncbi:MAG: YihA family ribosome biogenesis GTP-binding protein [Clostridia bacterium]|nr:YihA family ribosome biogenesis GTP-binding protein [Clostridia bacterium]
MNLHNASLTISAVHPKQYPTLMLPEIALAGRSNVGKSSFLNKMLNRKALARTSATPGKTATLNFYNIDNTMFFVDLPGYGYAKVSKNEQEKWANMINLYLNTRSQLKQTFLLVDSRHAPSKEDIKMNEWIRYRHGICVVIATKIDKLKKSEIEGNLARIYEDLGLTEQDYLFPFSSEKGTGKEEVWEFVNLLLENQKDE